MKITRYIFLCSVIVFLVGLAHSSAFATCTCPGGTETVLCYGAVANDGNDDSAAIQTAIDSVPLNCSLYFPAGQYQIDGTLHIDRDNITLFGDGISSELVVPTNRNLDLLRIPDPANSGTCPVVAPKNIVIRNLAFNGSFNAGNQACNLRFGSQTCQRLSGIVITQAENVELKEILVKNFAFEGISVSNGQTFMPKNISLWRVRTQNVRRNGLHLGLGENLSITDSFIEDGSHPSGRPI